MKIDKKFFLMFVVSVSIFWNILFAKNLFVWNLLWTQLEIWLDRRSNIWILKNSNVKDILWLQSEIIYRDNYDLVSKLDNAKSQQARTEILDDYILSISNLIDEWKSLHEYEQSKVNYYNNLAKGCESSIKLKNSEFSSAVLSYNYGKAETISSEIAELRACIAKNEVYAKAHASYASSVSSLNGLQKKLEYISYNKEKISKYYEILKSDLLKELYDISKTVNSNF